MLDSDEPMNYNVDKVQNLRTRKVVKQMTDMKRVTIAVPEHIDQKVLELRKSDKFIRSSYAEIVRYILSIGIEAYERDREVAS